VNGSGKTSVLDAVNHLMHQYIFDLYDQGEEEYNKAKERVFRTLSRRNDVNISGNISSVQLSISSVDNVEVRIYQETDQNGSVLHSTYTIDGNTIKLGSEPINSVPNSVIEFRKKLKSTPSIFIYYPDNRSVPSEPALSIEDVSRLSFIDTLKNAFDIKINFSNLFKWFRNFEDIENQKRLRENNSFRFKSLEAIRKIIPNFLDGFSNPYVNREGREELIVFKGKTKLSVSQLSLGERLTIALASDISMRLHIANPDLEDPLLGQGIVLIDEIEQHLHPKWQRDIVKKLTDTFPNIQFILTTHSPQVLSTLKKENVFILEDFKLVKDTPHTFGRDSNAILWDIFGVEKRPPESKEEFAKLYRIMDDPEKVDETADMLRDVEEKYGYYDEEVVRARGHFQFLNEA
jgi:predicted ATP-binding protein involved in virulence